MTATDEYVDDRITGATTDCPYVGLVPFAATHRPYFFGRDRDIDLLAANVQAFRLTILYGPSGVGKSSVINAGVVPHLRASPDGDRALVVSLRSWRDDPSRAIDLAAVAAAHRAGVLLPPVDPSLPLIDRLQAWGEDVDGDVYCIFDQFEDYFLYHEDPHERFGRELAACLSSPLRSANVLISLREDALGKLDRFRPFVPNLYANQYRLKHLTTASARAAILGPLRQHNAQHPSNEGITAEPELVEAVLAEVRTGEVVVGATGEGRVAGATERDEIETAHLQLVMMRLWDTEMGSGSRTLRLSTLQGLGGAASIVRSHLDATMGQLADDQQALAAGVFRQLVTPSGAKIAHTVDDLAEYADVDEAALKPVLKRLASSDTRVLRGVPPDPGRPLVPRYEIFHDALAPAILDWCTRRTSDEARRVAERRLADSRAKLRRERRRRARLAILLGLSVALLAATGFVLYRTVMNDRALQASKSLAAQSAATLDQDPAAAADLALRAWDGHHTHEAEDALRVAASAVLEESMLVGHEDALTSVDVVLGDGAVRYLTTSLDGSARIWDDSGEVTTLDVSSSTVAGGRFTPDGEGVITWSVDGVIRSWDWRSGAVLHEWGGAGWYYSSRSALDVSSDGQRLAYIGQALDTIHVVDLRTGEALAEWNLPDLVGAPDDVYVSALRFSPADPDVLVSADDYNELRVWSVAADGQLDSLTNPQGVAFTALAVAPDGLTIFGGGRDAVVAVWRWQEESEPKFAIDLKQLGHEVVDLAVSPDGASVIAAASKTTSIMYLDPAIDAWLVRGQATHVDFAQGVAISADGEFAVSVSRDGTGLVLDVRTGALLAELRSDAGDLVDVAVAGDGRIVTASADRSAHVWRLPSVRTLRGHTNWVLDLDLSADGVAATAGIDGQVMVWDVERAEVIASTSTYGANEDGLPWLNRVAITPDGSGVAAAGAYGSVWLWRREGAELIFDRTVEDEVVVASSISFSPDGTRLAVSSSGQIDLRNVTGEEADQIIETADDPSVVAWSDDGSQLAAGTATGEVLVWDAETLEQVTTLTGHVGNITEVVFSPDGRQLATSGQDRTIRVWDLGRQELDRTLNGHDFWISSIDYSDDGEHLVTGDARGYVGVWEVDTGRSLAFSRVHADSVNAIELADGEIMSAGDDQVVRIRPCDACEASTDDVAAQLRQRLDRLPTMTADPRPATTAGGD